MELCDVSYVDDLFNGCMGILIILLFQGLINSSLLQNISFTRPAPAGVHVWLKI